MFLMSVIDHLTGFEWIDSSVFQRLRNQLLGVLIEEALDFPLHGNFDWIPET